MRESLSSRKARPLQKRVTMITLGQILEQKTDVLLTVDGETSIREACWYFEQYGVGSFLVADNDHIHGIFTERDVKTALANGLDPGDVPVSDAMTDAVIVGHVEESATDALRAMTRSHLHHLPVVDGRDIVGIVTMTDLVFSLHGSAGAPTGYLDHDACPNCGTVAVNRVQHLSAVAS